MKILVLGMGLFVGELRQMGHDVVTCGCTSEYEVIVPPESFSIQGIVAALDGWQPDICLFIETLGNRVFPEGLQNRPFPLVYYSIDTHLNFFWLRHFATTCDAVITTQKDYVPLLLKHVSRAYWLPWANVPCEYFDLGVVRDIPISFVGAVDDFRPRRKALLSLIQAHFPLQIFAERLSSAEVNSIYSRSKIVVNEAIAGEVNFRVFEAMASGPLLLTDRVGNGLTDLFEDGRHLVTFGPEDVLQKIDYYLTHDDEREAIAVAGKLLVQGRHVRENRVKQLADILADIPAVPNIRPTRLGKAYFLMLRRGLLDEAFGIDLTYRTAMEEVSGCRSGARLADLAAFLTGFAEGDAGHAIYKRAVTMHCADRSLLLQWSMILLNEKKDSEAKEVLLSLSNHLCGVEQQSLKEALSLTFPSVNLFLVLASLTENGDDSSFSGFVSLRGRQVPLSGSDIIAVGLSRHPDNPQLLEMQGDICMKVYVPLSAAENYLRAATRQQCGSLLRKSALALEAVFKLDEAEEVATAAWEGFNCSESAKILSRISRSSKVR